MKIVFSRFCGIKECAFLCNGEFQEISYYTKKRLYQFLLIKAFFILCSVFYVYIRAAVSFMEHAGENAAERILFYMSAPYSLLSSASLASS